MLVCRWRKLVTNGSKRCTTSPRLTYLCIICTEVWMGLTTKSGPATTLTTEVTPQPEEEMAKVTQQPEEAMADVG